MLRVNQPLEDTLRQYEQRLIELEKAKYVPKAELVLDVLLARDRVKNILITVKYPSALMLLKLVHLLLKQSLAKLLTVVRS